MTRLPVSPLFHYKSGPSSTNRDLLLQIRSARYKSPSTGPWPLYKSPILTVLPSYERTNPHLMLPHPSRRPSILSSEPHCTAHRRFPPTSLQISSFSSSFQSSSPPAYSTDPLQIPKLTIANRSIGHIESMIHYKSAAGCTGSPFRRSGCWLAYPMGVPLVLRFGSECESSCVGVSLRGAGEEGGWRVEGKLRGISGWINL